MECYEVSLFKIFFFRKIVSSMLLHGSSSSSCSSCMSILNIIEIVGRSPISYICQTVCWNAKGVCDPRAKVWYLERWRLSPLQTKMQLNLLMMRSRKKKSKRSMPDNIIWSQVKSIFLFNESARFKPLKSKDLKASGLLKK